MARPSKAGSSSAEGGAAGVSDGAGGDGNGAKGGKAGSSATGGSEQGGDTSSAGGAGGAGNSGSGNEGGVPADPDCAQNATWGTGVVLSISTDDDDIFQSITPDELSIAFKSGTDFYVADRDNAVDDFDAPQLVTGGSSITAVTLSPNGLRLIVLEGQQFSQIVRDARGDAFSGTPDQGPFEPFNETEGNIPTDQFPTDPVLGAGDDYFIYTYTSPSADSSRPTIYETYSSGVWDFGTAVGGDVLWSSDSGEDRRIPTGISADYLTIFYRDQVNDDFRAAWRLRASDDFDHTESLGDWKGGAPNGACSKLYYSADGNSSVDLFVTTKY